MGKFQPGLSGNPAGRRPGTVNRLHAMLRDAADKVLPLVVEKAIAGDADSQRFILDRALPRVKPMSQAEPISLPAGKLHEQIQALLRQVADGALSATVASELAGMVEKSAKVEEVDQLRDELAILKHALEVRGKKKNARIKHVKKTV
jgi:ribosomal protein L29